MVSIPEIEAAAERWAKSEYIHKRKTNYSKFAKARFIRDASEWFSKINCLEKPVQSALPFEEYLTAYIAFMREEQGLSENTIISRNFILKYFLIGIKQQLNNFNKLIPIIIDKILIKKYQEGKCSRNTIQTTASIIRGFVKYAETNGWCKENLAYTIKSPRVYRYESLPSSPDWEDIKKVLASTEGNYSTNIRDRAVLMLLSIYGMRCNEVAHLLLDDIDWKNELIYLRRAKSSKPQTFPLSHSVGVAILRYLKEVRANDCSLREVFLCMRSPYRPLDSSSIFQIVNRKLKPLNLNIKHHGPHALRHACATHLINKGISLKEISDHLGHQGLETTRIYAKVDLLNLRKVADFEIGDLL